MSWPVNAITGMIETGNESVSAISGGLIKPNFTELATRAPKSTYTLAANPTATNNASVGYQVGSRWINTATGGYFVCLSSTTNSANWGSVSAFGTQAASVYLGTGTSGGAAAFRAISESDVTGLVSDLASKGTVSSVGVSVPNDLTVTGSPITTAGTIAIGRATQTANTHLAGPTSGAAAAPTFRALVAADIPSTLNSTTINSILSLPAGATGIIAMKGGQIDGSLTGNGVGYQASLTNFSAVSSDYVYGNHFVGLPVMVASGASHAAGIVPDPGSNAGSIRFLREDATWAAIDSALVNVRHLAGVSGDGSTGNPYTGYAANLPQGNNLVYYFEGGTYSDDVMTFTGDHLQFVGDGFNKTILKSKTGQNVIEYTTGDASFCVFRDFQILGTGSGSGHGIWIHDTNASVAIQNMVMSSVRLVSLGGDGLRIGYPGTTTNIGAAPVYSGGFRDIVTTDCGGHGMSFQSVGPATTFDTIFCRNVANGKFGLYFDVLHGVIRNYNGNDNLQPTAGAPTIDGGGCIRITGVNGLANAIIENSNFEAAGSTFVDLRGSGGVVQLVNCTWNDNNPKRGVADRIGVKADSSNMHLVFRQGLRNTGTQWANSQAIHAAAGAFIEAHGTGSYALTQFYDDADALTLPVNSIGSAYDSTNGYYPLFPYAAANKLDVRNPSNSQNPFTVDLNSVPYFIPQLYSATNVGLDMGGRGTIRVFGSTLHLGYQGDVTVACSSPFKFLSSTVAGLPAASSAAGQYYHATDARNPGEGVGAGTGALVFSNGTIWITVTNPGGFPAFVASGASHASGYVPDPGATAGTKMYLREDATFSLPAQVYNANVTPVTVNAQSTSAQNLMSFQVSAGDMNVLKRTLVIKGFGLTTINNTSTLTIALVIGANTLITWTAASITATQTNCPWDFEAVLSTQTIGANGKFEVHGTLDLKGTGGAGATTRYSDGNTAASGTVDLTAANTIQVTATFSFNGVTPNTCSHRQMVAEIM